MSASARRRAAQIGLAHARILRKLRAWSAHHDAAGLQHVAAARGLERIAGILLDQQHAGAGFIDRADGAEDVPHDQRREAERRLVEAQAASAPTSWRGRAPASAARRRDSVPAFWPLRSRRRGNMSNMPSIMRRTFAPSRRFLKPPSSRFSRTVRNGNTCRPSGTSAMPSSARSCDGSRVMSWPRNVIAPARGCSSPAIARSVVDLPAPFAPISATISPSLTSMRDAAADRQLAVGELEILGGEQRAHISSPPR